MNIVDQWLPENVYCYSQVFCADDCAEIMNLFPHLALNIKNILPEALAHSSPSRRASYLVGRGCALSALNNAGYISDDRIGRTTQGLPNWPKKFVGSISHAMLGKKGMAIAVVAHADNYQSIAIDCEPIFSVTHANELAPLTASIHEQRLGERLELDRAQWLTMVYSLKETLYKLLYAHVNCFMPFEAAEVLSFDVGSGQACLMLTMNWGELTTGQRFWLKTRQIDVVQIGKCVVSFAAIEGDNHHLHL